MSGSQHLLLGAVPQVASDPNFEYTTLLLPGNGTNGAQNNTFLDSSTNAFSITRNGNTTQGTFSPFSQTGWGNFFNSGAIIRAGSSANLTLGSGSFTCECWVFPTAFTTTYAALWDFRNGASFQAAAPLIWIGTDGKVNYQNASIASSSSLALNQWTHVAVVRNGTTVTMYFNGTSVGSVTDSTTMTNTYCAIGAVNDIPATYYLSGYVSNSRVVVGSAVYTANFTPPTAPLTAISGTAFLTCQSNRFVDNSANAFAITATNSPSIQAFSPFNPTAAWSAATYGGSGYFDGSGDWLSAPSNSAFDLAGDFTIELWFYATTVSPSYQGFCGRRLAAANYGPFSMGLNGSSILFSLSTSGVSWALNGTGGTVAANCWNHVAFVRNGSACAAYLNGTSVITGTVSGALASSSQNLAIGTFANDGGDAFNGYISNFRIVKGTAVYTANFTPPTAPLTAITNTSLLLNLTNAGIYDATSKNDLETVGNAQISTTQSKFGGSSMYFDGTGDYLAIPATQNIVFGTADFTIEMWVYSGAQSGTSVRMMGNGAGAGWGSGKYVLTTNSASNPNKFIMGINNSSPVDIVVSTTTFNDSTWKHVAITRYGNTFRLFVNGILESTGTTSVSVDNGVAAQIRIGSGGISGDADWAGYIDDLRITKGIARYTTGFTPPTAAFPLL